MGDEDGKKRLNMAIEVRKLPVILEDSEVKNRFDISKKDNWNPADVWLEYGSVPSFSTLAEYNNWLVDSLHAGKGWIGVSLKKGGSRFLQFPPP